MSISIECTECGRRLKVKDEFAGRRIKCPHCQGVQRVGGVEQPPPTAVPNPPGGPVSSNHFMPDMEQKIAPMAYAAMFSAVPILLMPFLFVFPLTFGFMALRDIKRNPHYLGRGRAIFGIAWGVIGILLTMLYVLIVVMSSSGRR